MNAFAKHERAGSPELPDDPRAVVVEEGNALPVLATEPVVGEVRRADDGLSRPSSPAFAPALQAAAAAAGGFLAGAAVIRLVNRRHRRAVPLAPVPARRGPHGSPEARAGARGGTASLCRSSAAARCWSTCICWPSAEKRITERISLARPARRRMLLKVMQVATRPTGALVSGKDAGDDTEPGAPEPGAQSPAVPDAAGGTDAGGPDPGAADRGVAESTQMGAGEARLTQARLLVIEDEPGIVDFLRRGLDSEGFVVEAAADGREGERRALSGEYDIVLLDLMLPGRSGLDVLGAIRRERPRMPVIVLTARGELEDRVAGLDAGAVDYVVKPFSVAELAARLRAHLRALEDASSTTLRGAGIEVDLLTRTVRREGRPVSLSMTEFELLAYMLRNEGQVLSREELLRAVWGEEQDRGRNVVDVYIGYLRRKLADQSGGSPIVTVRSVGYRFGEAG